LNDDGEGEVDQSSVGGGIRGGSPTRERFCGGEAVARHGRWQAITGWSQFDLRGPMAAGPRRGGGCPRQ
jgi:hypothetical protein